MEKDKGVRVWQKDRKSPSSCTSTSYKTWALNVSMDKKRIIIINAGHTYVDQKK
jgi:hypothetical protein